MKNRAIIALLLSALASAAFANGNSEKLTVVEGEVLAPVNASAGNEFLIRTREGRELAVVMSEADRLKLQIQERNQIRIGGVFLGETEGVRSQAKVFARTVSMDGKMVKLENPVQLTEQERLRLRTYEAEQEKIQERSRTAAMDGSSSGDRSGTASGGSAGGVSGGSSGGKK